MRVVRRGFTIVELLVACTILGLLVGLLLPAIETSREAARRMECGNRLRQIGIAIEEHHERGAMPVGWTTEQTGPRLMAGSSRCYRSSKPNRSARQSIRPCR